MNADRQQMASTLTPADARPLRIAIVGGGLAGLATAAALTDSGIQRASNGARLAIELFESRRMLGGRATSYRDPETGELIDNCQHVSLGCCTNFDDFCRRTSIDHLFTRESTLTFFGPNRRTHLVRRSRWLPAPLHLAPSLLRMSYLSWRERCAAAVCLRELALRSNDSAERLTFGTWLRNHGQSEQAVRLFWTPVIVGALSEEVDRASLSACRKVFADAFLRHACGYEMRIPKAPLRTLYEDHVSRWLQERGVSLHLGCDVRAIEGNPERATGIVVANGEHRPFDKICVAVPWGRAFELFDSSLAQRLPFLQDLAQFEESPITSVHVWCSRPIQLPACHAVLPGRFSQWVFDRSGACPYYQVVISASREVASLPRGEVIALVRRDLEEISGQPLGEIVMRAKVITEHKAVFSPTVDSERWRPSQSTPVTNLFFAGDWTATGWPATMEGAIRSGYLAAEGILAQLGAKETILAPDLPAARLSRWLLGVR
jgi:squalene-associated FAD-dependent desaturase